MPADPNRVRDVFLAAVELPPEQRPAFLAEACGGDAELRAEVERLLAAHADPDSILEPRMHPRRRTPPRRSSPAIPGPSTSRADVRHRRVRLGRAAPDRDRDRGAGPDGATATLDHPDPDATTAAESASPRPAQPGSRRAKGSAPSSPAGTRWSR